MKGTRQFVFKVVPRPDPEIRRLFATCRSVTDEEALTKAGPDRKSAFSY